MVSRLARLRKLHAVQQQLKSMHETRHAGHLASARAAKADAAALAGRFDEAGSLSTLFPEIYHRRIEQAMAAEAASLRLAEQEAARVAAATLRLKTIERAWKDEERREERRLGDRERLDILQSRRAK